MADPIDIRASARNAWQDVLLGGSLFLLLGPIGGGLAAMASIVGVGSPGPLGARWLGETAGLTTASILVGYLVGAVPALLTGLVAGALRRRVAGLPAVACVCLAGAAISGPWCAWSVWEDVDHVAAAGYGAFIGAIGALGPAWLFNRRPIT